MKNVTIKSSPHFAGGYVTPGVYIKEGTGPLQPKEVLTVSDKKAEELLAQMPDILELTEAEATVNLDELGDTIRPITHENLVGPA